MYRKMRDKRKKWLDDQLDPKTATDKVFEAFSSTFSVAKEGTFSVPRDAGRTIGEEGDVTDAEFLSRAIFIARFRDRKTYGKHLLFLELRLFGEGICLISFE
jgi:hypothetical protein